MGRRHAACADDRGVVGKRAKTSALLFTGGYGPAPLTEGEQQRDCRHAAARARLGARRISRNGWSRNCAALSATGWPEEMAAFIPRAPADLRVNTLKSGSRCASSPR